MDLVENDKMTESAKQKQFRKTKKVDQLLANNPNITLEEIAEFRKIYKQKLSNIRRFCEKHPEIEQQTIIDSLPLSSVEELKSFKILRWLKNKSNGNYGDYSYSSDDSSS
jgi:hypothetical protein